MTGVAPYLGLDCPQGIIDNIVIHCCFIEGINQIACYYDTGNGYTESHKMAVNVADKDNISLDVQRFAKTVRIESAKKNGYRQSFKVYDAVGKALGSSDYDSKSVIYTLIQMTNEDGTTKDVDEVLDQNSIVPADSVIRITVQGKGNYIGGSVSGTYRILKAGHDISKAAIQINNQEYTGQPVMITDQSQLSQTKSS